MNDLTMDQFTQEMKTFEGLCNKALVDLDNHINNTNDLQFKLRSNNKSRANGNIKSP